MLKGSCPSCAGEMNFASKIALYAVCPWCSSLVLRQNLDISRIGLLGELQDDGTPIRLGTTGGWRGRRFEVIGRIQMEFPQGYWNEWYLSFSDGKDGWLGETQGFYAVNSQVRVLDPLPAFETLRPGMTVAVNGENFEVKDLQRARCIGGEGELPFAIESGYEAPVADLITRGRRFATLDYSSKPPLAFVGEHCEFDDLDLANLRELEGW